MNQKRNKGITLIALVITIIVLLILAGVTINMVLGDDGIIAQAQEASQKQNEKKKEEYIEIAAGEAKVSEYLSEAMTEQEIIDIIGIKNVNGLDRFKGAGLEYRNNVKDMKKIVENGQDKFIPIPIGFSILEGEHYTDGIYAVDSSQNIYKWYSTVDNYGEYTTRNAINWEGCWGVIEKGVSSTNIQDCEFCESYECSKCLGLTYSACSHCFLEWYANECPGYTITYCDKCWGECGICASCGAPFTTGASKCLAQCDSSEYKDCINCEIGYFEEICEKCGEEGCPECGYPNNMEKCSTCNGTGIEEFCFACGFLQGFYIL